MTPNTLMVDVAAGALGSVAVMGLVALAKWWRRAARYNPRPTELRWWHWLFFAAVREYRTLEKGALPDGTRVRLVCDKLGCNRRVHEGVWVTSWTPRRNNRIDDPDDYRLAREDDGYTTYATRGAINPVDAS